MGFIGIFLKPSNYNFRSWFMREREKGVMERVKKNCQVEGLYEKCVSEVTSLRSKNENHHIIKK